MNQRQTPIGSFHVTKAALIEAIWGRFLVPDLSSREDLGMYILRVQTGRRRSAIHADVLDGCNKILSRNSFNALEKLSPQGGGILGTVGIWLCRI